MACFTPAATVCLWGTRQSESVSRNQHQDDNIYTWIHQSSLRRIWKSSQITRDVQIKCRVITHCRTQRLQMFEVLSKVKSSQCEMRSVCRLVSVFGNNCQLRWRKRCLHSSDSQISLRGIRHALSLDKEKLRGGAEGPVVQDGDHITKHPYCPSNLDRGLHCVRCSTADCGTKTEREGIVILNLSGLKSPLWLLNHVQLKFRINTCRNYKDEKTALCKSNRGVQKSNRAKKVLLCCSVIFCIIKTSFSVNIVIILICIYQYSWFKSHTLTFFSLILF